MLPKLQIQVIQLREQNFQTSPVELHPKEEKCVQSFFQKNLFQECRWQEDPRKCQTKDQQWLLLDPTNSKMCFRPKLQTTNQDWLWSNSFIFLLKKDQLYLLKRKQKVFLNSLFWLWGYNFTMINYFQISYLKNHSNNICIWFECDS